MNGKSIRVAGVVAALSVGLYAGVAQAEGAGVSTAGPRYTAQQMFEGIVFRQGPVAQQHPDLVLTGTSMSVTPQQMAAVESSMTKVDPSFFQVWGSEITSGDPYKAEESLTRMSKDFAAVVAKATLPGPNVVCYSSNPCGGPSGGGLTISPTAPTNSNKVAAINYGVQVNIVAGVNVGAVTAGAVAVGVVVVVAAAVILPVAIFLSNPGTTGPNGVLLKTMYANWAGDLSGALIPA